MSQSDDFDRAVASLNDAALDDALWLTASAHIDKACGLMGNRLVVGKSDAHDVRIYFARFCFRGHRRREGEREYFTVYHPVDERVPRVRALPDGKLVHVSELYTSEELRTSRAYNEAVRERGVHNALNVRMDGPDESNMVWEAVDAADSPGWGSARVDMIRRLLPHIRQFVRVRHALFKAEALGAAAVPLLGNTRVGVVYVEWRGRILDANDRALAILRRADGLFDEGGFLRAQLPGDNARLQKLLADALPTFGKAALSGSMPVRRSPGTPPLVLHAHPVPPDHGAGGNAPVAALVLITEPGRLPDVDPDLVAASLDLTPSEARVAVMLSEGKAVRTIAAALESPGEHGALSHQADSSEAGHLETGGTGPAGAVTRRRPGFPPLKVRSPHHCGPRAQPPPRSSADAGPRRFPASAHIPLPSCGNRPARLRAFPSALAAPAAFSPPVALPANSPLALRPQRMRPRRRRPSSIPVLQYARPIKGTGPAPSSRLFLSSALISCVRHRSFTGFPAAPPADTPRVYPLLAVN